MNAFAKCFRFTSGVLIFLGSAAFAEESEWPKRSLRFEAQNETQPRPTPSPTGVTHVAVVSIGPQSGILQMTFIASTRHQSDLCRLLARTPIGKSMSERQRALADENWPQLCHWKVSGEPGPRNPYVEFYFYAVSEDDARKMAQALMELCDTQGSARFKDAKGYLAKTQERIPEAEKELAELKASIDEKSAALKVMREVVDYARREEVWQDIRELSKALRSLQVEMAGIQAKIDAISKLRATKPGAWLDQLQGAQDIEMAGVLARKKVIEGQRSDAHKYADLLARKGQDEVKHAQLSSDLKVLREQLHNQESMVADPPDYMKPLTVLNDTVRVFPVEGEAHLAPSNQPTSGVSASRPTAPASTASQIGDGDRRQRRRDHSSER